MPFSNKFYSLMFFFAFSTIRSSHGMRKSSENGRFILYMLYAWGIPLLITGTTLAFDYYKMLPDEWRTGFGLQTVWFPVNHWRAHLVFFLIPIGFHIICNVVLFVLTSIQCSRIKSEIHRMQHSSDEAQTKKKRFIADKAKFV